MYAALEAGGTKFVCGVGDATRSIDRIVIPTTDVATTLAQIADFLDEAIGHHGPLRSIGIGSFGPLELDSTAADYGCLTTTPKPGWKGADMRGWLHRRFEVPVAIDTDVNAAALAEAQARRCRRLAYVTIGTGIGVGLVIDGKPQHGFGHPEAGHIPIRRHKAHAAFAGVCPAHGDCLEGLAAGPAIAAAWGTSLDRLPADHPAWGVQAHYIGQLCATLIPTLAPDWIVLGGGVMSQHALLPLARDATLRVLGGYCAHWTEAAARKRIVPPLCAEPSGLVGAYLLAEAVAAGAGALHVA